MISRILSLSFSFLAVYRHQEGRLWLTAVYHYTWAGSVLLAYFSPLFTGKRNYTHLNRMYFMVVIFARYASWDWPLTTSILAPPSLIALDLVTSLPHRLGFKNNLLPYVYTKGTYVSAI